MNVQYTPKTHRHKLVHLMEECAEVTQAAAKVLRFGLDSRSPRTGRLNRERLREEMRDVVRAIERVRRVI